MEQGAGRAKIRTVNVQRWRNGAILSVGLAVAVVAVWVLANSKSGLQNALIAVAAVVSASTAVFLASRGGVASRGDQRAAHVALGMHMKAWPHVHLFRTPGNDGDPWTWHVTIGRGKEAARIVLRWNLDGRQCEADTDRLEEGKVWSHPSYLDASVAAENARHHIGSIAIEWEDGAGYLRWRSRVEIAPGSSRGTPAVDDGRIGFVESEIPLVNNAEPVPLL